MNVLSSEWRDRIGHWLRTLKDDLYEPLEEIRFEAACTMEYLTPEEAGKLPLVKAEPGFSWGREWEYAWFHAVITLPERADGERIVMNLAPGGESTLFVNGKSFGTYRADWITQPHQFYEDNVLARSGAAGESFDLWMETYAGHDYPEAPTGHNCTGPVLPGAYGTKTDERSGRQSAGQFTRQSAGQAAGQVDERSGDDFSGQGRRTLGLCTYGIWNEDAYQLLMDAQTLMLLLDTLDPSSLRASKIAQALEQFTLTVDFEQPREARILSYREGRNVLRTALQAVNGSSAPVYYAVGNAHLDLAWLWPMAETYRKTARTFAAQLRLIEEYPQYQYLQSQPAAYEMCREHYPELFGRILEAIRKGQWIAEGAMWVEPDTNMAGGEALIRQLLYGKEYYRDVLGTDSVILWLPDTFGYSAALPQILKGCGVKYLVTQKIFWSYNDGESFPYHYFTWEGMDGSKVTAFLPTSYTYQTDPQTMNEVWQKRSQTRDLDAFLIPFGYGDGGGGPARDHIEYLLREEDLEGMPRIRMESPLKFFEDMDAAGGPAHTWTGELYFNAHRGTYTTQAMVKKNNRKAEMALREMELWGTIASVCGIPYDAAQAERLWKEVLLHQFHDILPGSGIGRIYEETNQRMSRVIEEAQAQTETYLRSLCGNGACADGALIAANALPFETEQLISLPERFAGGAVDGDGTPLPTQKTEEGVRALVKLPSMGICMLYPAEGPGEDCSPVCESAFSARLYQENDAFILENSMIRARVSGCGEITSLIRKPDGMEYAASVMNHLRLFQDIPRKYDAWDIDSIYGKSEMPGVENVQSRILCSGGLEAVLEVKGMIGNSAFTQKIRLAAGEQMIRVEMDVDWQELHRLLKVSFPTSIYTAEGYNEIQFGYVKRPTTRSRAYDKDRFEVCNHRYSALYDGRNGAAVLNDCKYGISMEGGDLELTLLRASAAPQMRADNGHHQFTYAFLVWEGSFEDGGVIRKGYELNLPVRVTEAPENVCTACTGQSLAAVDQGIVWAERTGQSLAAVDQGNVILETVKPAQDGSGDIILRLYEVAGCAVNTKLQIHLPAGCIDEVYETDLLEQIKTSLCQEAGMLQLKFRAFEIRTLRIRRKK